MTEPRRDKSWAEGGFTLIEVVVVLAILGLVIGGLTAGLISTWRSDDATLQRLAKSHDAQLTASYFVNDAQSSGGHGPGGMSNVSVNDDPSTTCPDPSVTGSLTEVLRMSWTDTSGSSAPATVSKMVNYVLVTDTTTNATVMMRRYCVNNALSSDTTVAHYVHLPQPWTPMASCSPAPTDCTGTPQLVTLTVTETQAAAEPQPYVYSLTGDFRQVPPNGTPSPPPSVSWLTLGSDSVCGAPSTDIASGTELSVNGGGTVASNGSISGTITPTSPPTPTLQNPGTPIPDPYRALPPPSTSGLPTFSDGNLNDGPGVYTTTVVVTDSVDLQSGIYILDAGISVSGDNVDVNGSDGVMLYLPPGEAYSVSGQATVDLSPLPTGTYKGVVIFQGQSTPAPSPPLTLSDQGRSRYRGVVYAPDATVNLSGDRSSVTSLVAQCGNVFGGGTITVGTRPPRG